MNSPVPVAVPSQVDGAEAVVGETPSGEPRWRLAACASALLLAPAVALVAAMVSGGTSPTLYEGLPDPGMLTRWGMPVTQAVRDLSAAVTIGLLVLAACCAPARGRKDNGGLTGARGTLLRPVAASAALWSGSTLALVALSWSDAVGWSLGSPGAFGQVMYFASDFDLGRALLLSSALAAMVAVGALWARRTSAVGALAVLSIVALWPLATVGHSAGDINHDVGVNSLFIHLLAVTIWVGGVVGLVVVQRRHPEALAVTASHFSALAGLCFVAVAASGVTAALLQVDTPGLLISAYGALLSLKVSVLVLLGVAGWWHRRRLLPRLHRGAPRAFGLLVLGEVVLLASAVGLGAALSRTDPPDAGAELLSPAQAMLGYDLPGPLGVSGWFSTWRIDTFFTPVAVLAVVFYLRQVLRLHRRGDSWPIGRSVAWVSGWAMLVWAVSGAPGVYGRVLFSMHMVQHMTIATAVPALLVLAAPVTLALRALPKRHDASRGPREWLLLVVHLPVARLLAQPLVAAPMFIGGLVVFYSTGLFELSLRSHTAHVVMVLHFLITGYLFASGLIGIDPGVPRPAFHFRMLILMVTFGAHAFFSTSLMASTTVLAEDWFAALGRTWGDSLSEDQYTGASIGWALGDYPLLILGGALIAQWFRTDRQEQIRLDRRADRDGDSDLNAYNAYLASLPGNRAPRNPS